MQHQPLARALLKPQIGIPAFGAVALLAVGVAASIAPKLQAAADFAHCLGNPIGCAIDKFRPEAPAPDTATEATAPDTATTTTTEPTTTATAEHNATALYQACLEAGNSRSQCARNRADYLNGETP